MVSIRGLWSLPTAHEIKRLHGCRFLFDGMTRLKAYGRARILATQTRKTLFIPGRLPQQFEFVDISLMHFV